MIAGMTLGDVVDRLDGLVDDHTIYALSTKARPPTGRERRRSSARRPAPSGLTVQPRLTSAANGVETPDVARLSLEAGAWGRN